MLWSWGKNIYMPFHLFCGFVVDHRIKQNKRQVEYYSSMYSIVPVACWYAVIMVIYGPPFQALSAVFLPVIIVITLFNVVCKLQQ